MAKKDYIEWDVIEQIKKKNDLRVKGKQIMELMSNPGKGGTPSRGDVGIKTRGKIDFLVNYCNYVHFFVPKFEHHN